MTATAEKLQLITSRQDPEFEVTLYKNVGVEGAHTLEHYLESGGYEAAKKALNTMKPEQVVDEVKRSGLRGRGGAGFPTGLKWSFMPKPDGRQRFIVCNADESEPGSFKDRYFMEDDPHQLLEGMVIAGYAIGATKGVLYVRGEYYKSYERLRGAIQEATAGGYLGKDLFGSGFDFEIILHRGAGAYICGEETSLMNSFEGLRANPRLKPPFPAQAGVYGLPTTINNVETFASAVHIVNKGAEWYAGMGTDDSKGPKLFQVSGPAVKPGVYELPLGATFRELIYDLAGGPTEPIKALIPWWLIDADAPLYRRDFGHADGLRVHRQKRLDAGDGRGHLDSAGEVHRQRDLEPGAFLRARVVRQMHALPRGYQRLDDEDVPKAGLGAR